MSQVNVNTPGGAPEPVPPADGGVGYGMIVGILVAIVIIALLVYFLLLNPGNNNTTNTGNTGNTGNGGGETTVTPGPSAWHLVDIG